MTSRTDAKNKNAAIKRIGIIGYNDVQALDVVGPGDAFTLAASLTADSASCNYEVLVLGLTSKPFAAESGLLMKPHTTLDKAPALDTVIIPGGRALRLDPTINRTIAQWLKARSSKIRRIASVCTGTYALAPSGLLDGLRVTTHWRFAQDLAKRYPRLQVDANAIFIKDGSIYTSAGVTAGIDLALALIEEDCGPAIALRVARELVVYLKRTGGQEQYSEPLRFQVDSKDSFSDLVPWIRGHMKHDLSVEALAARANLSPRQFSRRFKTAFGVTPGEFVEDMRLDEARRHLSKHSSGIEGIADAVGFASADSFRRAFERRFGIAPSAFRGRFPALT